MREAEKKRLVKLWKEARKMAKEANSDIEREMIFADYLLDNGVIVPPCKAGQTVYRIVTEYNGEIRAIEGEVFEIAITHAYGQKIEYRFYFWAKGEEFIRRNYSLWCNFAEVGKTVFLSEAEAKYALKNRRSVSLVNGHIEE